MIMSVECNSCALYQGNMYVNFLSIMSATNTPVLVLKGEAPITLQFQINFVHVPLIFSKIQLEKAVFWTVPLKNVQHLL